MIDLDANFLIAVVSPESAEGAQVAFWKASGEKLGISAVAWGEFLCGPLAAEDEALARKLLPRARALKRVDAERAAHLFNATGRRSRSFADCCIAASAIGSGARLATNNHDDFKHMVAQGLQLA